MTLSQKRVLFTATLTKLLSWAAEQGLNVALDQVKRTEAEAKANAVSGAGIANSNHLSGLAADLILYGPDWSYKSASADYKALGAYWKTLHPLACWGGDFKKQDGNHFSFEHNGVK